MILVTAAAQAAVITGSSHRNQYGELQRYPNIPFTGSDADDQIRRAVIGIGTNGLFDGSDFLPTQVSGPGIATSFGPLGTSVPSMDLTGFSAGKTWQGHGDDALDTVIGGPPGPGRAARSPWRSMAGAK